LTVDVAPPVTGRRVRPDQAAGVTKLQELGAAARAHDGPLSLERIRQRMRRGARVAHHRHVNSSFHRGHASQVVVRFEGFGSRQAYSGLGMSPQTAGLDRAGRRRGRPLRPAPPRVGRHPPPVARRPSPVARDQKHAITRPSHSTSIFRRRSPFGKARHGHDVAAYHDDELGARGEPHFTHVTHVAARRRRLLGSVEKEYCGLGDAHR